MALNLSGGVEKLRGSENYGQWKFAMKMLLIHEELHDCIELGDDGKVKNQDPKLDLKALSKISLMVCPSCYVHIKNAKSAKEAWDNLMHAFEDTGLLRRLNLLKTLFTLNFDQFQKMENYVNAVMELGQKLNDIGSALEDEFLAIILLAGLPPSLDPLVLTLENLPKLTTDIVKAKLLQEDVRDTRSASGQQAGVLVARKKRPPKKLICHRCRGEGHYQRDCPSQGKHVSTGKQKEANWTAMGAMKEDESWIIDSGATCHMTKNKRWIREYEEDTEKREIKVANGEVILSEGQGDVSLDLKFSKKTVKNVKFVPQLSANLLSVSQIAKNGNVCVFTKNKFKVFADENCSIRGKVEATGTLDGGVYKLDARTLNSNNVKSNAKDKSFQTGESVSEITWHRRLGHLNYRSMCVLKKIVKGLKFSSSHKEPCIPCIEGKLARKQFKKVKFRRATQKLELIHSDLVGPMSEKSLNGSKYLLTFIDDFSRKVFGYFLKSKSEVTEKFLEFKTMIEKQTGCSIKRLRSDNGGEYVNENLKSVLARSGIVHETTIPYCPEMNGVAERMNRTLIERARSMLQDSGLGLRYWPEAVGTAIYLKNRSPTAAVRDAVPESKFTGNAVDVSNLKVFGCASYVLVPKKFRKKFDPKAKKLVFIGYCENGYRLLDIDNPSKVTKSRDVVFIENEFPMKVPNEAQSKCDILVPMNLLSEKDCSSKNIGSMIENNDNLEEINVDDDDAPEELEIRQPEQCRYPLRNRELKSSSEHEIHFSAENEPTTYNEAVKCESRELWKAAMKREYQSLLKNETWELTDLPKGKSAVQNKWVYKIKSDSESKEPIYKARLVAKGFTQKYGRDYNEIFSPVVKYSTLRMLLALAAEFNWSIEHLDVVTAFLNGDLEEEVYMKQPQGFEKKGEENKVCHLKKSLYGLKQSSRKWYEKMTSALKNLNFKQSEVEPCLFTKVDAESIIILALYVDDIYLFCDNEKLKQNTIDELKKCFEMRHLGPIKNLLGARIQRKEGKIYLDQSEYIQNILSTFGMEDCKPMKTPMELNLKLSPAERNDETLPYQQLIGSLTYLAVCSRPDIAHVVSRLAQFNNKHSEIHWNYAKRVLRYLQNTKGQCLVFQKTGQPLFAFADSDWGGDSVDRRSYSGYAFILGGGAISYESRKQKTVALSSTEAEYMALSDSCKEAKFLKGILKDLTSCHEKFGYLWQSPIVIYNDNRSAQFLTKNEMVNSRTKHIDVRHHFIRGCVKLGDVEVKYCETKQMVADILTKPLSADKTLFCCKGLGLVSKQPVHD